MHRPWKLAALLACAPLLFACGDVNVAEGEFARITYALHSDYLTENVPLTEVSLITGHSQAISTTLTSSGEEAAGDRASDIRHVATPPTGVELTHDSVVFDDDVPSFDVTVSQPGSYTFAGMLDGAVFDQVELVFDVPETLDLLTRVRTPYSDAWENLPHTDLAVGEGSQVAFLPIPVDASGERLAGNFSVEVTAEPGWAVAPSWNILGVYEQSIVGSASPVSLFFIEPGQVTVTLTDMANGVSVSRDFEVFPVEQE